MQGLQRLAHLLRSAVLVHRVVWLHWVARSRVLLSRGLRNRRTAIVGRVRIVRSHLFLSGRCSMIVLRWWGWRLLLVLLLLMLLLLVASVAVLLAHGRWGLSLMLAAVTAVAAVLRVRVRC
jgi:hypothetical protein